MDTEDPATRAGRALSKAIFGNAHFSTVIGHLDRHHSDTVTVHAVAQATHLADAIVKPIFERLVDSGALVANESATRTRTFAIVNDDLEPLATTATWIATRVEFEMADVETRLWELGERDLGPDGVDVLRKLAIQIPREERLSWLASAITNTTKASVDEVDAIVRDSSR